MYDKIPLELMNVGATFQKDIDIAFVGKKDKFILIYLDDITIFFQSYVKHLNHIKQTFQKCKKYGLSLKPKKSLFSMQERNLPGHIASPKGIRNDLAKVEDI